MQRLSRAGFLVLLFASLVACDDAGEELQRQTAAAEAEAVERARAEQEMRARAAEAEAAGREAITREEEERLAARKQVLDRVAQNLYGAASFIAEYARTRSGEIPTREEVAGQAQEGVSLTAIRLLSPRDFILQGTAAEVQGLVCLLTANPQSGEQSLDCRQMD